MAASFGKSGLITKRLPSAVTRAARVAALVLLAWQAVVAQAHVHFADRPVASFVAAGGQTARAGHRPDTPLPCPVCREVAHAGQYLSPDVPLVGPPAVIAPVLARASLPMFGRGSRSHAWRSRAPPFPLHA